MPTPSFESPIESQKELFALLILSLIYFVERKKDVFSQGLL